MPKVGRDLANDMRPLSRQTVGKSAAAKSRLRREAVAKNLAIGRNPEQAVIEAGYSPMTAHKKAYLVIRYPEVQFFVTEAVARVLTEEKKQFDDIVRPYVKALDAKVVVKMPAAGMVGSDDHRRPSHSHGRRYPFDRSVSSKGERCTGRQSILV